MSRILLDVDFNDQTTDNHALNSDWKESPIMILLNLKVVIIVCIIQVPEITIIIGVIHTLVRNSEI